MKMVETGKIIPSIAALEPNIVSSENYFWRGDNTSFLMYSLSKGAR